MGAKEYWLAHDHFRRLCDDIHRANWLLDVKTWGLAMLDVLLLALVVTIGTRWAVLLSTSAVVTGVVYLTYGARIGMRLPGGGNWDEVWRQYVEVDDEARLAKVLSDLLESIEVGTRNNERKGRALDGVARALLLQCVAVVLMVMERV